jgi:hypothetical protein
MANISSSTSSSIVSSINEGGYNMFLSIPYNRSKSHFMLNDQGEVANPNSL